jgi:hypothetical protein
MLTAKPGEARSFVEATDAHPKREVAISCRVDPAFESSDTTYGLRIVESFTIQPGVHLYVIPVVSPRTFGSSLICPADEHVE